jgi:hypothetical protein
MMDSFQDLVAEKGLNRAKTPRSMDGMVNIGRTPGHATSAVGRRIIRWLFGVLLVVTA